MDATEFNAEPCLTLETARLAATERAHLLQRPVDIFEHIGGRHPKRGVVAAQGTYLWRDHADEHGQPLAAPKFFWRLVETVEPVHG